MGHNDFLRQLSRISVPSSLASSIVASAPVAGLSHTRRICAGDVEIQRQQAVAWQTHHARPQSTTREAQFFCKLFQSVSCSPVALCPACFLHVLLHAPKQGTKLSQQFDQVVVAERPASECETALGHATPSLLPKQNIDQLACSQGNMKNAGKGEDVAMLWHGLFPCVPRKTFQQNTAKRAKLEASHTHHFSIGRVSHVAWRRRRHQGVPPDRCCSVEQVAGQEPLLWLLYSNSGLPTRDANRAARLPFDP